MLYCKRVHPDTMRIGSPALNNVFASYLERRQPEATAKQVFTLYISY